MSLDSKYCNYEILRAVLEMIDSMFCYVEDNIKALSWQSFFRTEFLFPFSAMAGNKDGDPGGQFGSIVLS